MKRTPLPTLPDTVPARLRDRFCGAPVFDSSCSPEARVYYIDRDGGMYLKLSPRGTLAAEAKMTEYFHGKGLAPEVLEYTSGERDVLLTRAARGEDATHPETISDPCRLADTMGKALRALHETSAFDCPVPRRMDGYLALAEKNYREGRFDPSLFPTGIGFATANEAYAVLEAGKPALKNDTLIHGDFCLPNIMLENWRVCAFIDLGNGGVGDRHVDLFWGAWTLIYNLKTDKYCYRFFDAYGRDRVDADLLRTVAAAECFG